MLGGWLIVHGPNMGEVSLVFFEANTEVVSLNELHGSFYSLFPASPATCESISSLIMLCVHQPGHG